MQAWAPAHPLEPQSRMGAMVSAAHAEKVMAAIRRAQDEGATLLTGGRTVEIDGVANYVQPTLLTDVNEEMALWKEEIFWSGAGGFAPSIASRRRSIWRITISMRWPPRCGPTICTAPSRRRAADRRNDLGKYRRCAGRHRSLWRQQTVGLWPRSVAARL